MANAKYTIKHPDLKPGLKIGRWTLLKRGPQSSVKTSQWFCKCECGKEGLVKAASLKGELSLSCGCYHRERVIAACTKHNKVWSREYRSYWGMKQRCYQKSSAKHCDHQARGIKICSYWLESFENFYADMGPMPSPKHSIDRIDNDGGYWCGHCEECKTHNRPANCRWATQSQQSANTRRTRIITFNGRSMCLTDWAREIGLSGSALSERLRYGWSIEDALTIPPGDFSTGAWEVKKIRKARHATEQAMSD